MARKTFDSEFCGSLPLNNVNLIQDYGYLLVLSRADLSIVQMSENTPQLLNKSLDELISTSLHEYVSAAAIRAIREVEEKGLWDRIPVVLEVQGTECSTLLHIREEYIILEIEKAGRAEPRYFSTVFHEIKHAIAAIEMARTVKEVSEAAIHELRKISGFDGVLMYQFDADWNGKVIAEEKTDQLEAYLGQTFPASDIPKQARELYLKNPYRQIPDRDYTPYGLFPVVNPITHSFLDLSDCNLRSVPAVHREYMKNMGISASMSIRVLRNNALWGLISCHHIQPKYINHELCAVFELLSTVISSRISSILYHEEAEQASFLQKQRLRLSDELFRHPDLGAVMLHREGNVRELFGASGAALTRSGQIEKAGDVPGSGFIENLMLWLDNKDLREAFATDHFAGVYDEASLYSDIASGLLVIPIDSRRSEYLLVFRPEVQATIDWGGNPNDTIRFEPDGKNYHPRNSFTLWKEEVKNHSAGWTTKEVETANALSAFLYDFRNRNIEH